MHQLVPEHHDLLMDPVILEDPGCLVSLEFLLSLDHLCHLVVQLVQYRLGFLDFQLVQLVLCLQMDQ